MFEGLRSSLRKKLGQHTRYSAPGVADAESARRLKVALEAFRGRSRERFSLIFLRGKAILVENHEQSWFDDYERAGLVFRKAEGIYLPCVHVFPLNGRMIATDLATHRDADQVFALMLEQLYIVAQMGAKPGDRALELCVGSGVNCLFLSDRAASVTAVDLSPRALEFARFNATMNPGRVEIDLRKGSLFEPFGADERFDFVLVNPPFEPVPPGVEHFMHSQGGEDGLDVVRQIMEQVPGHLAPGGRFEMFTWSPGDDKSVIVTDLVRATFPERRIEVHRVDSIPLEDRIRRFRAEKGYPAWRQRLIAAGHTHISDVYIRVEAEGPAETVEIELPELLHSIMRTLEEWR